MRSTSSTTHFSISIHALREEGDPQEFCSCSVQCRISIHALREEGDVGSAGIGGGIELISIHALREEGDRCKAFRENPLTLFLSTPSARRATGDPRCELPKVRNFYPRPPRGGRQKPVHFAGSVTVFLSTPSARRATHNGLRLHPGHQFLSTPSARRATLVDLRGRGGIAQFLSTPSARRATCSMRA